MYVCASIYKMERNIYGFKSFLELDIFGTLKYWNSYANSKPCSSALRLAWVDTGEKKFTKTSYWNSYTSGTEPRFGTSWCLVGSGTCTNNSRARTSYATRAAISAQGLFSGTSRIYVKCTNTNRAETYATGAAMPALSLAPVLLGAGYFHTKVWKCGSRSVEVNTSLCRSDRYNSGLFKKIVNRYFLGKRATSATRSSLSIR